jgi:hypothetical protein
VAAFRALDLEIVHLVSLRVQEDRITMAASVRYRMVASLQDGRRGHNRP